ncbi:MAG TPA: hypothetical protein VI756_31595, partial [Blastocatellia bacterium]
DQTNSNLSPFPNPDALQEITVMTSNYGADFGRNAGGMIGSLIKSGTDQIKGNVRYTGINNALNARGFFDPRTPPYRLNNVGGQLGGPVRPPFLKSLGDRLKFFVDYEATRSYRETTAYLVVPTVSERAANFSGLPRVDQPLDPFTKAPYPGGQIPSIDVSPIARKYFLDVPLPNRGANYLVQMLPTQFANGQAAAKLDLDLTPKDNLSFVYLGATSTINDRSGTLLGTANTPPLGGQTLDDPRSSDFIVHETRTFSASTVNQVTAKLTATRSDLSVFTPGVSGISPSTLGFVGIHPQSSQFISGPSVYISTLNNEISGTSGLDMKENVFDVRDDISHVTGRNLLKFGVEAHRYFGENVEPGGSEFRFDNFNTFGTGNAIADYLIGLPETYSQTTGFSAYPTESAFQFYGMDEIHMSPSLTLNAGLRYELEPPAVDRYNHSVSFYPDAQSVRFPGAPEGLLFVGDPDPALGTVPRGLYNTDHFNFAPRLSAAFAPADLTGLLKRIFGNGQSVIRAGFGIYYDHTQDSTLVDSATNEPFFGYQTLSALQIREVSGGFAAPFGQGPNPWPLNTANPIFTPFPNISTISPNLRTPYTYQYDLVIQRNITAKTTLELSYIGYDSFRTLRDGELNIAPVVPGATEANIQSRRVFPEIGAIISADSSGRARTDSFQVRVKRSFSRRLMFQSFYVFSKSLDNGSLIGEGGSNTDPFDWSRSPFDRRQGLVSLFSYDLPNSHLPVLRHVLSGLRTSGIYELWSGTPLDIYQTEDTTLTGSSVTGNGVPDLVGAYNQLDPRTTQTFTVNGVRETGNFFFNPQAFSVVTVNNYTQARSGNLTHDVFSGPGLNNFSTSLAKSYKLSQSRSFVLRADVRNVLNHANFLPPSVQADSVNFGQVTSALPGRTVQFSARLMF